MARLIAFPLFAVAIFVGTYFYFYRDSYDPPERGDFLVQNILRPESTHSQFVDQPEIHPGVLLIDGGHLNDFDVEEVAVLLDRIVDRGHEIDFIGDPSPFGGFRRVDPGQRLFLMEDKLRRAGSYAVIVPDEPFSAQEIALVEEFIEKGGRLLLIGDPTRRRQINSLSERFGISFQTGYLFNVIDYDLNFRNIFVSDFEDDEITRGLNQVALYTAGPIKSSSLGLAFTGKNTRSSTGERAEQFSTIVKGPQGRVLAISDLTFMISPQNSILDNDRLIANIADFLTTAQREFTLEDFPHFLDGRVDVLLGNGDLFDLGSEFSNILDAFGIDAEIRGIENLAKDTVYLGLYEDAQDVTQYLQQAGIQVNPSLRTPFTSGIDPAGTAIVALHSGVDRDVLIILASTPGGLADATALVATGGFRFGLVADSLGVYNTR